MLSEASIILRFLKDRVVASMINTCPNSLVVSGETYYAKENLLGDYDCLRNSNGELVGFRFQVSPSEQGRILKYANIRSLSEIRIAPGLLNILLTASEYAVDEIQASSFFYESKHREILIGLHEWAPWGKIAFKLESLPQ